MELLVKCQQCGAKVSLTEEHLKELPAQWACLQCKQMIVISQGNAGLEVAGGVVTSSKNSEANLPQHLGKYQVIRRLASGGMGDIFLAKMSGAVGFEREVALKLLHPHLARDEHFSKELADEAKTTVMLNHPNIVQMYDFERQADLLFCVMEYVPGKSLAVIQRTYRRKGAQIPVPMAVYIIVQALEGLAYAHGLKDKHGKPLAIVHRDISPQNILVNENGWVKIIDFGIAKAATRITQTQPGIVKGKFAYMAPEQYEGVLDHRADLFSMGVVLWETLAGVRLFYGGTEVETLKKVFHMAPPAISLTRSGLSKEMDRILSKALAKDPSQRYNSAVEFKSDLLRTVAPASMEDLKAAVDIDASGHDDASELTGDKLFADVTPVAMGTNIVLPPSRTPLPMFGVANVEHGKNRRWIWLSIFLGLVLLSGILFLIFSPNLTSQNAPLTDGGGQSTDIPLSSPLVEVAMEPLAVANPMDAGMTTSESVDAGASDERVVAQVIPKPPQHPNAAPVVLTQKMIDKVMRVNAARLQNCADTYLGQDGSAKDVNLILEFSIESTGSVASAQLKPANLASSSFGKCLLERVRRLKFPAHRDNSVTIAFPLQFKAVP